MFTTIALILLGGAIGFLWDKPKKREQLKNAFKDAFTPAQPEEESSEEDKKKKP